MKAQFILALLCTLVTIHTQGITFAPPPTITPTTIFSFSNSTQDSKLIGSDKLEVLNLVGFTTPAGTPATNVTLTVYNRTSPTNMKTKYNLTLPGNWKHVKNSYHSLSCSVLFETVSSNVGLVRWDRTNGTFTLLGALPLTTFTTDPVTIDQMGAAIHIGEDCAVLAYTSATATSVYRASADWQNIHLITLPAGFNLQTVSLDLMWGISGNVLYKYDQNTFQYVAKKTFFSHQQYNLKSERGRVLVWASNSTVLANVGGVYNIQTNMAVWALNYDWSTGAVVQIGVMNIQNALEGGLSSPNSAIRIMASPQLSKFGFGYSADGVNTIIRAKHVDFNANQWYDLMFTDPILYFSTVQNINADTELDFNDYYLVVRNGTYADRSNPPASVVASNPVEQTWQIAGSNFTLLRSRPLATDTNVYTPSTVTRELTSFMKTLVDPYSTDRLIVLDIYAKNQTEYDLVAWDYGNLRSNNQIVKPLTPSYINFTQPATATSSVKTNNIYQWGYFHPNGANQNISVYSVDNSTASHYRINQYELTGTGWKMVFQNRVCKILANAASVSVKKQVNGVYTSVAELFSLLGASVTANSVWGASDDCTRIRLDGNFYHMTPGTTTWAALTPPSGFTLGTVDANITIALSTSGSLYKYSPSGFTLYFTPPVAFPANSEVVTWGPKVGLASTTATSAWFVGLIDNGTHLNKCINYSNPDFVAQPKITTSPSLTKVLILGSANKPAWKGTGTEIRADLYVIECPNFQNISVPLTHLDTPANVRVNLGQEFLHFTKVDGSGVPLNEIIYYFKQGKVTLQVSDNPVTVPANTVWVRSQIWRNATSQVNYLLSEYVWTDITNAANKQRLVNVTEISGQQAVFNSENSGSFTAQIVEGQVKLCAPGCTECTCATCLAGYVLDSTTSSCRPCAPGCATCSSADTAICYTCSTGSFLNSTTCSPCNPACESCSGTATSCSACPPGQFFFSAQCNLCPKNCFACSSATVCTTCREGFAVSSTGQCRGCAISCAKCNPLNITQCTDCADGLYLDTNNKCVKCPENCLSCGSATACAVCFDGYTPNSAGVCVLQCQLPCLTCLDNQPTMCTSCPFGASPVSNVCNVAFACNTDSSCQDCGFGLNYYWASTGTGANCLPCPTISNCVQCDELQTLKCSICSNGYYLDNAGSCVACNSNCTACESDTVCSGCKAGWTMKKGQTEGRCRACESPCLTCRGDTNFCTSCVTGFTKDGWKCKNNTYIEFRIVITAAVDVVMNDIDNIVCMIYAAMTKQDPTTIGSTCDKSIVTLSTLASGSTVVGGTTSASGASTSTTITSLGSYPVSSSTLTGYGGYASTSSEGSSKTGLIIGVVIGGVVLVVIVVVFIIYLKKRSPMVKTGDSENGLFDPSPNKKEAMEESGFDAKNVEGGFSGAEVINIE